MKTYFSMVTRNESDWKMRRKKKVLMSIRKVTVTMKVCDSGLIMSLVVIWRTMLVTPHQM